MIEDFKNSIQYFLHFKGRGERISGRNWQIDSLINGTLFVKYNRKTVMFSDAWGTSPSIFLEHKLEDYFENIYQPTTCEAILYRTLFPSQCEEIINAYRDISVRYPIN